MRLSDTGLWTNQNLSYARAVQDMVLAEVIIDGGIRRKESRGSHYRSDFLNRDDAQFKTTVASLRPGPDGPTSPTAIAEVGLSKPRLRNYAKSGLNA